MASKTLLVLAFAFLGNILTGSHGQKGFQNSFTFRAYYNWPLRLPTLDAFETAIEYVYDYVNEEEKYIYEMTLTDLQLSTVLFRYNTSTSYEDFEYSDQSVLHYTISNITKNTSTLYQINVKVSYESEISGIWNVSLNVSELPTTTCREQNNSNFLITHDEVSVTSEREYSCLVPRDGEAPLELVLDENFTVYWLFNCNRSLPDNAHLLGNKLVIQDVDYETNPGVYSCAVEYNGMTRYRIHRRLCVKQRTSSKLSISCSDSSAPIGGNVTVMCEVDAGLGKESDIIYHSEINKLNNYGIISKQHDNISCTANLQTDITFAPNTRFSCELTHTEGDLQCFSHPPTQDEVQAQRNRLSIRYTVRNVQAEDTGEYVAIISGVANSANTTFHINIDKQLGLRTWIMILIICLCCLLAIALMVFLFTCCFAIEIKWTWKKVFGPYTTEKRLYAAYLAYYYSREMEQSSRDSLDSLVKNFNETISKRWGAVYDVCREPDDAQYRADNIKKRLTECHRVIMILTPEYIKDEWSVYETYEALQNVVENGIPIIFITLPETKAAIQQLDNNAKTALRKALKRHSVINWTGNLPFSRRFRIKLKLFMPKLMKVDDNALNYVTDKDCENGNVYSEVKEKPDTACWENDVSNTMYFKSTEQ